MRPQQGGGRRRRSRRRHLSAASGQSLTISCRRSTYRRCKPRRNSPKRRRPSSSSLPENSKSKFPLRRRSRRTRSSRMLVQAQIARSGIEMASGILDVLARGLRFLTPRRLFHRQRRHLRQSVADSPFRASARRHGRRPSAPSEREREILRPHSRRQSQRARSRAIKGPASLRKRHADLSAGALQARSPLDPALDARHRSLLPDRQRPARAHRLAAESR